MRRAGLHWNIFALASERSAAADRRRGWGTAVRLLETLADRNDEVPREKFRRACSAARAGWGVWLRVLEAAEEADAIMIRDGTIHIIGDVGALIESDDGVDEGMNEDDDL